MYMMYSFRHTAAISKVYPLSIVVDPAFTAQMEFLAENERHSLRH